VVATSAVRHYALIPVTFGGPIVLAVSMHSDGIGRINWFEFPSFAISQAPHKPA
jgi:hypothetical protein